MGFLCCRPFRSTTTMSDRLSFLDIVQQEPQAWFACSEQQRVFLLELIASAANGRPNPTEAVRVAYPAVKNPRVWASRLLTNKRVRRVLDLHKGVTPLEAVLADVRTLIKKSQRKNAHLELLVRPWLRTAAALEVLAGQKTVEEETVTGSLLSR